MAKQEKPIQPLITEVPLTAEAREQMLDELFAGELPHKGELFVPDDDFYIATTSHKRAEHMLRRLCIWLGVKPGHIGLEYESNPKDVPDGRRYTIYLESSTLRDEFVLGAYLAYVLTRYLVEERKQVHLMQTDQQAALLASASIVFGFGVVINNGISPAYNKLSYFRLRHTNLLKSFPLLNYSHMTLNFLKNHQINPNAYLHTIAPWASKRMNLIVSKRPAHAIRDVRHRVRVSNIKLLGFCWLMILIIGLGIFTGLQRVKPTSASTTDAGQHTEYLRQLTRLCEDSLAYDRKYADPSDIQTERALNADAVRCQSLQNQVDAAERGFQKTHSE